MKALWKARKWAYFTRVGGIANSGKTQAAYLRADLGERGPPQVAFMGDVTSGGKQWAESILLENQWAILSEVKLFCQDGPASGGLMGNPLPKELEEVTVVIRLGQDRERSFSQGLMPELI